MASTSPLAAILLVTLIQCLFFLVIPQAEAQSAPAPESSPVNLTAILVKGGQYTSFIRLLQSTQVMTQIENQLNNSNGQGLTVFAPTDNAFNNLKSGTINSLSQQDQVELALYHVLPKYYSFSDLQSVSNPVRTQGSSQNGGVDNLNFTSGNNQVNVTSGVVTTAVNNPLREQSPLSVYEVDKVLLPTSLFGVPAAAPAPNAAIASNTSTPSVSSGGEPVASPDSKSSSSGRNVGLGLVAGIGLACMGVLLQ
ncbi:fasciclin-like arabinogalactan protein 6 [Macadamia integrifolia]|uniref:fasciclin-like arabinogalactan protein 6 n=1 Tax=Macadamia integrifolia TaxID=60698 RepID=UPI001C52CF28|nr:fasciclin-like arabinogalactan protein 6 [Macadamia integrifolia]